MQNIFPVCFNLWLYLLGVLSMYEAFLQRPSISFLASYATYLTGEPVSLICQMTTDHTIHGYTFFRNDQDVHRMERSSVNKYKINNVKTSDAGSYTCLYWVSDSRGKQESEVSLPVSLSVLDQPSTPSLLIQPKQSLYFEGESVTLKCEHPPIMFQANYNFHKDNSKLDSYRDTLKSEHYIPSLSKKDSGLYDCQYWVSGHQRTVRSSESIPQSIMVTALSTSPLLNFLPSYTTFIKGENLTMECVAPSPVHVTLYRFYKEGQEFKGPSSRQGLYKLQNITIGEQAEYTCMYWSPMSNREIPSTQSATREVYVIDPPSGRIRDGGNVTLYCTTPAKYERTIFYFLNETEEIISISTYKSQTRAAVTINMKKNNITSTIKYSCQYKADIKGRLLLSPKSPHVEIIVITSASLLWLIGIVVAAGIVILIIIVSLIYWVLLSKKGLLTKRQKYSPEDAEEESKPFSEGGCKVTSL
ncbi:Fc receptor-like protein 5 isoform X2 [Mixophyes fleayi]|uniref:Fc receptor-like protein 5 isoform X2 n=1 Tax=Mixophyes fleayi TaxID=3061075 RepID=UPI003F4DD77D